MAKTRFKTRNLSFRVPVIIFLYASLLELFIYFISYLTKYIKDHKEVFPYIPYYVLTIFLINKIKTKNMKSCVFQAVHAPISSSKCNNSYIAQVQMEASPSRQGDCKHILQAKSTCTGFNPSKKILKEKNGGSILGILSLFSSLCQTS